MGKIIKILILIFVLFSVVVLVLKFTLGVNLENKCCEECLIFSSGESLSFKECLGGPEITVQCREFFEKNSAEEKECVKSISWISWLKYLKFWGKQEDSSTNNNGLGQWFGQACDKPYIWWRDLEEIEKRFKGKTWSGTFSADMHNQEGDGYSYDVKIDGLQMVFDSDVETFIKTAQSFKKVGIWTPCADESYLGFMGLKMEGSGEITYSVFENEIQLGCGGIDETHPTICVATNNPIVVDIKGKIFFSDEGIRLRLYPLKPGVNEEEILASCGENSDGCDTEEILEKSEIDIEGYCDGTCQLSKDKIHCVMNDDVCGEWHVTQIIGEGLAELVNERDIRLNENESTHIGSSSSGDSEKKYYITGTLYLKD